MLLAFRNYLYLILLGILLFFCLTLWFLSCFKNFKLLCTLFFVLRDTVLTSLWMCCQFSHFLLEVFFLSFEWPSCRLSYFPFSFNFSISYSFVKLIFMIHVSVDLCYYKVNQIFFQMSCLHSVRWIALRWIVSGKILNTNGILNILTKDRHLTHK